MFTEDERINNVVQNNKLLVYFHGNAEDLGQNEVYLMKLREIFGMSVLAMEYPGYGMFSYEIVDSKYDLSEK